MKKLAVIICAFTFSFSGIAQNIKYGGWNEQIVVGANANLCSSWLFSKAVQTLDDGVSDQKFSFGWSAGGSFEYRFNELIAVGLDLQYFSYHQKYEGSLDTQSRFYESDVRFNGLNLPVYAKIMANNGAFVELGWQFGFLLGARHNMTSAQGGQLVNNADVAEHFGGTILSPHLGLGFDFMLSDEIMITFGIRANYGINDVKGVDGLGNPISEYPRFGTYSISPDTATPSPNHVFAAGLFLGVRYAFDAGGRY